MSTEAVHVDPHAQAAARFRTGDRDAFQSLYEALNDELLAYLRPRCLGELDHEDFAHQIWLQAWSKRELFRDGHFRGWLFQLVRNRLADEYRRLQRRGVRVPVIDDDQWDEIGWTTALADDQSDALDALRKCLESVGGSFVDVLRKRLEGLSDAEIAAQLDMSIGAIQTRASRARDQLRDCIQRRLA